MIFKVRSEEVIFFMVSFGIINCHCEECFVEFKLSKANVLAMTK